MTDITTPDTTPADITRAYVDGVRGLLSGSGPAAAERGGAATPGADAAAQAEALVPLSADLTRSLSAGLDAPDASARTEAATRLLAKALSDLEVTAFLLQAELGEAEEEAGGSGVGLRGAERGGGVSGIDDALALLTGDVRPPSAAVRGGAAPMDLETARAALLAAVTDALDLVSERAAQAGQTAIGGVLGLGVAELAQAAALVGTGVAGAFGQGEAAARIVGSVASFAAQATGTVTALLGPVISEAAAEKVLGWVDEIKSGGKMAELVGRLYDTETTAAQVQSLITAGPGDPGPYAAALTIVTGLDEAYFQQIGLAERILGKVGFLTLIPAAAVPQARLLVAAVYIGLAGYIVLAGADVVDSPRLTLLKRVSGVRESVAAGLGAGAAAPA